MADVFWPIFSGDVPNGAGNRILVVFRIKALPDHILRKATSDQLVANAHFTYQTMKLMEDGQAYRVVSFVAGYR